MFSIVLRGVEVLREPIRCGSLLIVYKIVDSFPRKFGCGAPAATVLSLHVPFHGSSIGVFMTARGYTRRQDEILCF